MYPTYPNMATCWEINMCIHYHTLSYICRKDRAEHFDRGFNCRAGLDSQGPWKCQLTFSLKEDVSCPIHVHVAGKPMSPVKYPACRLRLKTSQILRLGSCRSVISRVCFQKPYAHGLVLCHKRRFWQIMADLFDGVTGIHATWFKWFDEKRHMWDSPQSVGRRTLESLGIMTAISLWNKNL